MSDHTDLMARIVAMEKEAYTGSDAVGYLIHQQETFPYWVNALGPATYAGDSEDIAIVSREVTLRLIVANLTEGYDGQAEKHLLDNLDAIILHLLTHPDLTSALYSSAPDYLYSTETELTRDSGLTFWRTSDAAPTQIGIEFILSIQYLVDIR